MADAPDSKVVLFRANLSWLNAIGGKLSACRERSFINMAGKNPNGKAEEKSTKHR
jgi:hypothetical protein